MTEPKFEKELGTRSMPSGAMSRSTQMLALSLVGAAAIIVVFVIATPLEDPSEEQGGVLQGSEPQPVDISPDTSVYGVGSVARQPVLFEQLQLPTVPEQIDVESLQSELLKLARSLSGEFPSSARAEHLAAQTFSELNQVEEAEEHWLRCMQIGAPGSGSYIGLATLYIESGREQKAVELLTKAIDDEMDSADLYLKLASAQDNLGNPELAIDWLRKGTTLHPQSGDLWLASGQIQNQLALYVEAEASLRKAIEFSGESQPSLFALSVSLARQDKRDDANEVRQQIDSLRKQVETPDDFQDTYSQTLARIATAQLVAAAAMSEEAGYFQQAEERIRRCLSIDPTNLQCFMSLSSLYRKQQRYEEALTLQSHLASLQPQNVFNHINLASVALQIGDINTAESSLKIANAIEPEGVVSQASLARLYLATGRAKMALPLAEEVVSRNKSAESFVLLATVYDANSEYAKAQLAIAQARLVDPDNPLLNQN